MIAANKMVNFAERVVGGDLNRVNFGARVDIVMLFWNQVSPINKGPIRKVYRNMPI